MGERPSLDRLLAGVFVFTLVAGAVVTFVPELHPLVPLVVEPVAYAGVWLFAVLYVVATSFWLYEAAASYRYDPPEPAYDPADCQVRILTIDAETVVQHAADAIPAGVAPGDRHVIAEEPLDIEGATVHVVPDGFDCDATDKGRALEWARRHLDCGKEFVLYLDEDTHVQSFDGFPDADVVQFREWPDYTGSLLAYWCEILRMGYQAEQSGFAHLRIPLYAWGGGIAVRESLERAVGWDVPTLIEDTVFVWRAAERGASFDVVDARFRNQAPPSLGALVQQRRRWLAGSLADEPILPTWYQGLFALRNVAWAFSPLSPFLVTAVVLLPDAFPGLAAYQTLSWALLAFTFLWLARGIDYYGASFRTLALLPLYPAIVALHAVGAAYGFLWPPERFDPTEKSASYESDRAD